MRRTVILLILALTPLLTMAQNRSGMGEIRELWDANCASCHGADLSGGMASSLLDDEWVNGGSDEELAAHEARLEQIDQASDGHCIWKQM